jgi:DNA-binding LytR/AlgR family response regulator
MSISFIIVDDEPDAHKIIELYASRISKLNLRGNFYDPLLALKYLEENQIDLLFLDINMPGLSGLELLSALPTQPFVIFTTAHSDYAVQSFDFNVVDYVVKPIRFERFVKAVNRLDSFVPKTNVVPLQWLSLKGLKLKIKVSTILYIESFGNYVKIYDDKTFYLANTTMKEVEQTLPANIFLRCHKKYIVNKIKIEFFDNNLVFVKGGVKIPVGISYRQQVNSELANIKKE